MLVYLYNTQQKYSWYVHVRAHNFRFAYKYKMKYDCAAEPQKEEEVVKQAAENKRLP
jgi:hypothetical protein